MVPHPLIHLKLARLRYDQLLGAAHRQSRSDLDATRDKAARTESMLGASARRACALLAGRLVIYARDPKPRVETHFAHREADGITVDLYWTHDERHDRFRVEVACRDGHTFTVFPATGKEAVEVYHHPFATTLSGRRLNLAP
jgi:hypothetical protein